MSGVVFASLATKLAAVFVETETLRQGTDWEALCETYLQRNLPDNEQVLIVLDGLDEAADWKIRDTFFPANPPDGLRVVTSARYLAGDIEDQGWRERLGWQSEELAISLPLPVLDSPGVAQVLESMGNPLDELATEVDVVAELHRLSTGDPLLVRLYVEGLQGQGEKTLTITLEDLNNLQPGLEGYINRWWEDQRNLWESQNKNPVYMTQVARSLLYTLAVALSPLARKDLAEVTPPDSDLDDQLMLDEILKSVARFVIGDGVNSGYVFGHPRLREYFLEQMHTRNDFPEWEQRFVNYGKRIFNLMEGGELSPKEAPAYAIQNYGAHLERVNASPEDFYALMCESWLRAWDWLEGTSSGFLTDVDRAYKKAVTDSAAIGKQVCAILCHSSVISISANISTDLIIDCVKHSVLTPIQGLVLARKIPDINRRVMCLVEIIRFLPEKIRVDEVNDVLEMVREIENEKKRSDVLTVLVPYLSEEQRELVIREIMKIAQGFERERERSNILEGLVPHLSGEMLQEALEMAREIENEKKRSDVLTQ